MTKLLIIAILIGYSRNQRLLEVMNAKELFDAIAKIEKVLLFEEENGTPFVMLHSLGWGNAVIKLVGSTNLLLTDCNGTRWLKTLGSINDTLERFGYPVI